MISKRYFLLPISALGMWVSFWLLTSDVVARVLPVGFYMAFWIVFVSALLILGVGPMLFYFFKIVVLLQEMAGLDKPFLPPLLMMLLSAILILVLPLPMSSAISAANGKIDMTDYVAYWLRVIGPFLYLSAVPLAFCLRRVYLSLRLLGGVDG